MTDLTVTQFGITESWDRPLVPQAAIVEAIGIVVLGMTTAVMFGTLPS